MAEKVLLSLDAYTVGWVCVTRSEMRAAQVLIDVEHETPSVPTEDFYEVGRMGHHNVVIVQSRASGKSAASHAATNMVRTFQNIRFVLMVGTGGGATLGHTAPGSLAPENIFLGDVVVSTPGDGEGGILHYGMGRQCPGGYQMKAHTNKPCNQLIDAVNKLQSKYDNNEMHILRNMEKGTKKASSLKTFSFPFHGREHDNLFESNYVHPSSTKSTEVNCPRCDHGRIVQRKRDYDFPFIHYGLIASADTVMRDGKKRDSMREKHNVLCFEMEAAGLMDNFPCLIIRGISDYADSHKNSLWQPWSALAAAAYAKDLLEVIQPSKVEQIELAAVVLDRLEAVRKDMRENLQEFHDGFDQISTKVDAIHLQEIFKWLGPIDFSKEQESLIKKRAPTGAWLLENPVFQSWVDGSNWQLKFHGEAGIGKTHLCALIVDYLFSRFVPKSDSENQRPVIYLYLSDQKDKHQHQTRENILGSLVKQLILLDKSQHIPEEILESSLRQLPRESTLKRALEGLLQKFERTYLIIDGMNYCQHDCLDLLKEYPLDLMGKGVHLSVLKTSPNYPKVLNEIRCDSCKKEKLDIFYNCDCNGQNFDLCQTCKSQGICCPNQHAARETYDTVWIDIHPREHDLEIFCEYMLERMSKSTRKYDRRLHDKPFLNSGIARFIQGNTSLISAIAKEISSKAHISFVVAKAWLDYFQETLTEPDNIEEPFSEAVILDQLAIVPAERLGSYFRERVRNMGHYKLGKDLELAFKAISMVNFAIRPLNILALQHGLTFEGDKTIIPFARKPPPREAILSATNGLLVIDKSEDKHAFVRLIHGSMRAIEIDEELHFSFKAPHTRMARLCLDYLEHELYEDHSRDLDRYPFLEYALEHWANHLRQAYLLKDESIDGKFSAFLEKRRNVREVAQRASERVFRHSGLEQPTAWLRGMTDALHLCAWYNLPNLIQRFLKKDHDINVLDCSKEHTPLQYACKNASLEAVDILLENEALDDQKAMRDTIGEAIEGHGPGDEARDENPEQETIRVRIVLRILESQKLSVNSGIFSKGETILMHAVGYSHFGFVKRLLQMQPVVDVNIHDEYHRTALWHAASTTPAPSNVDPSQTYNGIILLLLEKGAMSDIRCTKSGKTILEIAEYADNLTFASIMSDFQQRKKRKRSFS